MQQQTLSAKRKNDAVLRLQHDKDNGTIKITSANKAAERLLGYAASQLVGQDFTKVVPDRIDTHIHDYLEDNDNQDLADMLRRVLHFEIETADKQVLPASLKVFPLVVEDLKRPEYELLMRDVTLLKQLEELREYLQKETDSLLDTVTGVKNLDASFAALSMVEEHVKEYRNFEASLAFFYVDEADDVRDQYGGEVADDLQKHVCQLVDKTVRAGDIVGYVGDGVTIMVLLDCNSTDTRSVFKRINGRLRNTPFTIKPSGGEEVEVAPTLSVGYKQLQPNDEMEVVIDACVTAMERSYNAGGDRISEV